MSKNPKAKAHAESGHQPQTRSARSEKRKQKIIEREGRERDEALKRKRLLALAGIIGSLLLFALIYVVRLNRMAGHPYVDDAYYVLLGKALATGHGYTLINTPSPGIAPMYPPGFPLLLSIVFRIAPQFPQNLWLLKMVSIIAMLGAGVLTFYYFERIRQLPQRLAFAIALITALHPALAFYATSTVMSECVFTVFQLAAIISIERLIVSKGRGKWGFALLGAFLISYTFLIRSIGVALVVGAVAYLLKERLIRPALIFVLATAFLISPWMIYSRSHQPTAEQRVEQRGYIIQPYTTSFWQRSAGVANSGAITISELPVRIWGHIADIGGQQMGTIAQPWLLPLLGGIGMGLFSILLSVLAVIGFVSVVREKATFAEIVTPLSVAVISLWPWEPIRFLLPLTPFLIFYILRGFRAVILSARRGGKAANPQPGFGIGWGMGILAWCFAAGIIVGNLNYIQKLDDPRSTLRRDQETFAEIEAQFQWVREHMPSGEVLASLNPPLVYLYTGHKTISGQNIVEDWEEWKRLGVRYLVLTSAYGAPKQDSAGARINVVYQSRRDQNVRVIDLGLPSSRAPWVAPAPAATR